jgi:hypothetical protein
MKLRAFLLLSLIGSFSIQAQTETNSDIGLSYGSYDLNRVNLEFRKPFNDKWKLHLGVTAGSSYSSPWYNSSNIFSVTDSLVTERLRVDNRTQFTFLTGVERQLRQSVFSVSADLLFSYLQVTDGFYSKETELNSNNQWEVVTNNWEKENDLRSTRKTNYFTPGIQLKFNMNLPIKERFILYASIGGIFNSPIYLNESIQNDPLFEFKPHTKSTIFNLTNQANIGIRYKFKGK